MVIWLCGLSGAGKTTIGQAVYEALKQHYANVVFLDGDALREAFGNDLAHDQDARRKNSNRIARFCQLLSRQGLHVVCSVMTISAEAQQTNRENIDAYYEVLLQVPKDVLYARDHKGIYERARQGKLKNVCGVDIPFIAPDNPSLVIDNSKSREDVTPIVNEILQLVGLKTDQMVTCP